MEDRKLTPSPVRVRKDLCMDAMLRVLHGCFQGVKDTSKGDPTIRLHDVLMSGFAMMALKDPSLLAFERRRIAEEHNLRSIFHIKEIPCDTQMRTRLDGVDPDWLRPAFRALFRKAQRGKALEKMVFMAGCYLISLDGTGYFSSEKLFSPFCLVKSCSKSGKTIHHLQALGAAIVHPDSRTVIPLAPEPICRQDGETKNDCERNGARRWLAKFRKDHPHLRAIITEDALSPNAPHIRDILAADCHFILGVKEDDHKYLFGFVDAAVKAREAIEHDLPDPKDPRVRHFFRFTNGLPLNESNKDLLVNVLEYWEEGPKKQKQFCWVTDFTLTKDNVYDIMRGGRARWKIENETFNTLKNQGYHLEHNYGLGEKYLSLTFFSLMVLAFLVDQIQELCCALYREIRKKRGSKKELFETIRGAFRLIIAESMEVLYRLILAGPQKYQLVPIADSS
jgi:hypothetical protein